MPTVSEKIAQTVDPRREGGELTDLSQRPKKLGSWLPLLLLVICVADVVLRLLPIDWLVIRPFEALSKMAIPPAPFERNRTMTVSQSFGDIPNIGNAPQLRVYRTQTASSDSLGYRNPQLDLRTLDGVIFGDSFVEGVALNDNETLPTQLQTISQKKFYNAGGAQSEIPCDLTKSLELRNRVIIREVAEKTASNAPTEIPQTALSHEQEKPLNTILRGLAYCSPLKILASRVFTSLENDVLLPNPARDKILTKKLVNGDSMHFLRSDVESISKGADYSRVIANWEKLDHYWKARNCRFIALLVPDKYTVYGPLCSASEKDFHSGENLPRLEELLKQRGIEVLNAQEVLQTAARKGLTNGRYVFWKDDTHWTPEGVRLVAVELSKVLNKSTETTH